MSDACTVDDVLARQAGNVGAGTAHIALLYDNDALVGTAEMPRNGFSRLAAPEHHGITSINCCHDQFQFQSLWDFCMYCRHAVTPPETRTLQPILAVVCILVG